MSRRVAMVRRTAAAAAVAVGAAAASVGGAAAQRYHGGLKLNRLRTDSLTQPAAARG
eukprot:SAG11_NODE_14459_length_611_cov_1.027344_1_plen_56_part_10